MPDVKPRLLLTGAAGRIGRAVLPALSQRWEVTATDLPGRRCPVLDVTDLAACRQACFGVDAVVHMAGNPSTEAPWEELLPANVIGAYNIAQAAMDAGVRRLVLASSIQAVVGYPKSRQFRAEDRVRPDNLYGVTKAWSEALGSWVASASTTTVVVLRIGFCLEHPPSGPEATPLDLAMWLSYGDVARLVVAAASAPGVEYFVANGISANRFQRLDLETTRAALGYEPLDDAWAFADPGPTSPADRGRGGPWRKRPGAPR
ncbi:MAG TPA: NAD(P)-dependent oxidoreductase [Acidimicrobiales bacterium]|jgi:uronate dehydrogenase|nr:NAD(P)-dependent oxidoreductase [Acidimicrobiales bacterium]